MKIFLLTFLGISAIILIGNKIFQSAKRNLFKDQHAWSGKDINVKYRKAGEGRSSNKNKNYLKMIADESKIFLEEQSKNNDK